MSYLFWRLRKLVSAGKVLIRDGNTFRGILPEDVATAVDVDPETDGDLDLGSDASHRWRTLRLATSLILSASGTVVVGANTLIGAVADKLNATHLAIASQAVGDILYAATTTTFARLAAVGAGQVLKSAGVGTAPAWGAIGGTTGQAYAAELTSYTNLAASGVGVHAAIASDNAAPVTTGITNPAVPRAVQVVFAALWDGGDITIAGTNWLDVVISEVIVNAPGTTVQGAKAFKTITSISNELVGAGGALTATVQTGNAIGIEASTESPYGMLTVDGVSEIVAVDDTNDTFTPTTAPNGARDYVLLVNVNHNHSGTGLT